MGRQINYNKTNPQFLFLPFFKCSSEHWWFENYFKTKQKHSLILKMSLTLVPSQPSECSHPAPWMWWLSATSSSWLWGWTHVPSTHTKTYRNTHTQKTPQTSTDSMVSLSTPVCRAVWTSPTWMVPSSSPMSDWNWGSLVVHTYTFTFYFSGHTHIHRP